MKINSVKILINNVPRRKSVLKGVCEKVNGRYENGQKPCMILVACNLKRLRISEIYSSSDNDDDSLNHSSNCSIASDIVNSIDLANSVKVF